MSNNTHFTCIFINHETKQFTVSARRLNDPILEQWISYEKSIGFEFTLLATDLTEKQAKQLKSNVISSYAFSGYEKVIMNKDAILEHKIPD